MLRTCRCQAPRLLRQVRAASSAPDPSPPLLLKLRSDLKSAMKAKDTNRLNVLRAIIAETTNAAKTNSPIKTDLQVLSLLRKRTSSAQLAADQFQKASRNDLKEKEEAEITVLQEYMGQIQTLTEQDIRRAVEDTVTQMRAEGQQIGTGSVMKTVFAPGGKLDGQPAEKAEVARIVKELVSS